jgi:hypothetical protein
MRGDVLDKMKAAGITWVRMDMSWGQAENSGKGSRNMSYLDLLTRCIDMSRLRGMQVMVMVSGTPGWANGNAGGSKPPTNASDYGDFLGWLATTYRGKVGAWQLWNELNNTLFWNGTPAQYVGLLGAAYPKIKAADSSALAVLGGIMWQDAPYLQSLYAAGAKDKFDVVATHGYNWIASKGPEYVPADTSQIQWFTHAPAIHDVMVANNDADAQFWFSEVGWSTHSNTGFDLANNPWAEGVDEATQADFSVRAINYARTNYPWLGVMFFYKERSFPDNGTWQSIQAEGYGILNTTGTPRQVYTALKQRITGSP